MLFKQWFLVVVVLVGTLMGAAIKPAIDGIFRDGTTSFSIVPPTFDGDRVILQIYDEASDAFAANLNVMSQPAMALEPFMKQTENDFLALNLEMGRQEQFELHGMPAMLIEYAGKMQGLDVAFICITLFGEDRNYVGTGSCLSKDRAHYFPIFEESLRSMKLGD